MEPFISIVIPTYNEENFLPRLLRSIKKQKYKNKEVIVADAKSTDKTRELAEGLGAKVIEGGKVARGRNNGAEKSKGEIILFLDADVVLPEPSFLNRVISEFEKRKLSVATCLPYPLSDKKIDHAFHRVYNAYTKMLEALMPHAPGFCIMVRREVHEKIGGFDEAITLAEDHEYSQRAVRHGKFGLLRSSKIPVSIRRFERDGRLKIAFKYIFCELHMLTMGSVKNNLFNYEFGYEKDIKPEPKKIIK
jgi:glycosyltransferase involved in cell wall biosynthesis